MDGKVGARSIVPLLNRRNDENGTFNEAIKFVFLIFAIRNFYNGIVYYPLASPLFPLLQGGKTG
jgi:hypothetical protein